MKSLVTVRDMQVVGIIAAGWLGAGVPTHPPTIIPYVVSKATNKCQSTVPESHQTLITLARGVFSRLRRVLFHGCFQSCAGETSRSNGAKSTPTLIGNSFHQLLSTSQLYQCRQYNQLVRVTTIFPLPALTHKLPYPPTEH